MANYSYIGYNPTILTVSGGTATLSAAYDPDLHRRVFDVTDDGDGSTNTPGGAYSYADLASFSMATDTPMKQVTISLKPE